MNGLMFSPQKPWKSSITLPVPIDWVSRKLLMRVALFTPPRGLAEAQPAHKRSLAPFDTIELWEVWFMKNSLIATVLFGGFLAETALPVIAAPQTEKQTTEPAAPVTAAPQTHKKHMRKSNP